MIQRICNKPITESSYPHPSAAQLCDFSARGFVEEEYFIYGTSNIYQHTDGKVTIKHPDVEYVNRVIVRRPEKAGKASGRVVIEILNATSGMDLDRMWVEMNELLLRNGDTYIGITHKPSSVNHLKKFDAKRYAELSWKNPDPQPIPALLSSIHDGIGELSAESETGLFWDMLTDLGERVREGSPLTGDVPVKKIYLIGWSQSTGLMLRYLKDLVYLRGKSAFDGYLAGGNVRAFIPAINQYEIPDQIVEESTRLTKVTEPYVIIQTESESSELGSEFFVETDSDDPNYLVRTYEIPGSTHDDKYNMIDYYQGMKEKTRPGIVLAYPGLQYDPNDFPARFAFAAITDILYKWAEEGITPPRVDRIKLGFWGVRLRDRFGNSKGGWRLPPVDVPCATYFRNHVPLHAGAAGFNIFGCMHPFTEQRLTELYGTLAEYEKQVRANAEEAVKEKRLLQEDLEACVDYCVANAKAFGLK